MKVSARIKYYRRLNKLSQQDVADHCCVARETVANWEGGRRLPSLETVNDLSELFCVSVDNLIGKKKHYYVLVSSLSDKLADTSIFSFVLRIVKGLLAIIIMIPLLISLPLTIKENEERRVYNNVTNGELNLILQIEYDGVVNEYTFNRINDQDIENITRKYKIEYPNHNEIERTFMYSFINPYNSTSPEYGGYPKFKIRILLSKDNSGLKIDEIKKFNKILSPINSIYLRDNNFSPSVYSYASFDFIIFTCNNSFYIGAFLNEN